MTGGVARLDPNGRAFLYLFGDVSDRDGSRQGEENVNVVLDGIRDQGWAFQVIQDADDVGVEFIAGCWVAQEELAVFGAEDEVDEDLGERLRHFEFRLCWRKVMIFWGERNPVARVGFVNF